MWARHSRSLLRAVSPRKARSSRSLNGQAQIPHTTYFNPPPKPPRRVWRSLLLGTTLVAAGAYTHAWLFDLPLLPEDFLGEGLGEDAAEDELMEAMNNPVVGKEMLFALTNKIAAESVLPVDLPTAEVFLNEMAGCAFSPRAVAHICQLPSNLPCEDKVASSLFAVGPDPLASWPTWSILDGHAGPRTANFLDRHLSDAVAAELVNRNCLGRPSTPNDPSVFEAIKAAFLWLDDQLITVAQQPPFSACSWTEKIAALAPAQSGSCALMAVFDPATSLLRVANVGDSRAVLGRWDAQAGKYVALPMSHDHTGFNPGEVERLNREHPGENPIDPKTGRVHGIAVSRAFGDGRWKWSQKFTEYIHSHFWGLSPRPEGMIQTPPYLTAEPEIIEQQVQYGEHSDFLIMASDGLWDVMSSEDAVVCVEEWLKKFKPSDPMDRMIKSWTSVEQSGRPEMEEDFPDFAAAHSDDLDTYYDEDEKVLKWRVSPKHFVVENENCGAHMIKNALGGRRRELFRGLMTLQPPHSRSVRDDISVQVIFFGDFERAAMDPQYRKAMQWEPDAPSSKRPVPRLLP
ncbi:phosphatase 2C-like domain-containing protein [Neohortaea acidophila]|uniref:Phosphatase 2C-like domain-containing protein n=1 Tax=Neohortaea acidophila TaxID=245834 RepID=A0A6A6PJ04_9PEZI|nr:phosphatase 2C-like domain-containing protein [Neohortaea acidophila]KAF2480020.1 phosphatase 2C-like domain-containing protein [Neohortaea acidophila]